MRDSKSRTVIGEDHRARIAAAIAAAEARTSGEVYCVVAHRASDYRFVPLVWAALAALAVPPVVILLGLAPHRWPWIGEPWWIGHASAADVDVAVHNGLLALALAQALVFAVVALALLPERIRLALTPRILKHDRVQRAATEQFLARGLQRTRDRTGVLIFAALAERQAIVIADEGIYQRVTPKVWDDAVAALTAAAREGRAADGFIAAIGHCGDVLAAHFPPRADDVNELPDRIVEI